MMMTTTPKVLFLVASIAALFAATTAFAPTAPTTISSISTTTSLRSIIFEPPPEDNCELDGSDCEDSVFARKRQERNENQQATKDRYRAMGVALSEADFVQSVDQYQNNPTGGGKNVLIFVLFETAKRNMHFNTKSHYLGQHRVDCGDSIDCSLRG